MLRVLGYFWASPNTLLGLVFLPPALLSGGKVQVVRGVIEIHGGFVRWFLMSGFILVPAAAMTIGHVVLGRDTECLDRSRDHEHVHVRQYMRWGPFFLPAYFFASYRLWRRGLDPYLDNPFEIEAYAEAP